MASLILTVHNHLPSITVYVGQRPVDRFCLLALHYLELYAPLYHPCVCAWAEAFLNHSGIVPNVCLISF